MGVRRAGGGGSMTSGGCHGHACAAVQQANIRACSRKREQSVSMVPEDVQLAWMARLSEVRMMKRIAERWGRWMLAPVLLLFVSGCEAEEIVRASLQLAAAIVEAAS